MRDCNLTNHAIQRMLQRYGKDYDFKEINNILYALRHNQYLELSSESPTRKTVLLKYDNIPMKLVYDMEGNAIITALPLDIDEYNDNADKVPNVCKPKNIIPKEVEQTFTDTLRTQTDMRLVHNLSIKGMLDNNQSFELIPFQGKYVACYGTFQHGVLSYSIYYKDYAIMQLKYLIGYYLKKNKIDTCHQLLDMLDIILQSCVSDV